MTTNNIKLPTHREVDINTLRKDVEYLELRLRSMTEKNYDLEGNMYGLELKNADLRSDNQGLRVDLYTLRESYSNVCKDLRNITLENNNLTYEAVDLKAMVLSCGCNDACKSYRHDYISEGIDTVDGVAV